MAVTGFVARIKGKLKAAVLYLGDQGLLIRYTGNIWYPFPGTVQPQQIIAAGATQGNAAQITSTKATVTVATTNSSKGVKLPAAVTNLMVLIANVASHACKVWPNTGNRIGTIATNSADTTVLAANKATMYLAVNSTTWVVFRGA